MYTELQVEQAVDETVAKYLAGNKSEGNKHAEAHLKAIRGPQSLKPGETLESVHYYERVVQYSQFPVTLATRLREQEDPKFYGPVVEHTAKALEIYLSDRLFGLGQYERKGSVLFVPRPELDPKIEERHPFVGITDTLSKKDRVIKELTEVKNRIGEIVQPAVGLDVSIAGFSIIVPYADQLVKIPAEDLASVYGELVGVAECVSNVGVPAVNNLDKPLRTYSATAYREYNIALEVNPKGGNMKDITPPKGINKSLAGLERSYITLEYFDSRWMRYKG